MFFFDKINGLPLVTSSFLPFGIRSIQFDSLLKMFIWRN